jgi:hypothetical protein
MSHGPEENHGLMSQTSGHLDTSGASRSVVRTRAICGGVTQFGMYAGRQR